jgi:general stress protein YciG
MTDYEMHVSGTTVPDKSQATTKKRGFAAMSPDRVSEIASMGGKAAHQQGVAYEWDSETAREAGRKGGAARRDNLR